MVTFLIIQYFLKFIISSYCCQVFCKRMGPKLTQAEGMILGTAAKMFTIAGPVIVYGIAASVVYGLIYWITTLF